MENLQVMVILFIIVIVGYVANKLGYMNADFDRRLSSIVITFSCPCLVLSSVMGDALPDRTLILPLLGAGFLTYMILTGVALLLPRLVSSDHDERGMIGFAIMFANVGFIGYPIVDSIFGHQAVFYAALLNMPNTFFIFTMGVMLVKGEYGLRQFNPRVLLSPAFLAAIVAAALVALGIRTPHIIAEPIRLVGNITVPASLMIIGSSIANLPLRQIMGNGKVYATSFLRLIVVPVAFYYLFRAIGISPEVNEINTVVLAMPVASFGTMFCLRYNRDVTLMTETTFITTVASIITIPLVTMLFR